MRLVNVQPDRWQVTTTGLSSSQCQMVVFTRLTRWTAFHSPFRSLLDGCASTFYWTNSRQLYTMVCYRKHIVICISMKSLHFQKFAPLEKFSVYSIFLPKHCKHVEKMVKNMSILGKNLCTKELALGYLVQMIIWLVVSINDELISILEIYTI